MSTEALDPRKLEALNTLVWVKRNGILLDGRPMDFSKHSYQIEPLQEETRGGVLKKGAQMGFTSIVELKSVHGLIHGRYPQGVLYLFPTRDDVTDFSKGRFKPLIDDNPSIAAMVSDTDAANVKRIGRSMLYLRGARSSQRIQGVKKTSSQLKSVPVDRVVFDEVDEMEQAMVDLAMERMSHSVVQEVVYLSTPTIPDYGIDKLYQDSDQRVWMIRCQSCNGETCLELEFPDCILERSDGTYYRACKKCGKEITPSNGRWFAQVPSKSKTLTGWWISQLNSAYVNPGTILRLFRDPPNGNIAEIYNSKLGMAYIAAENRLTPPDLWPVLGRYPMLERHPGPTAMGVDVGKDLHVVIVDRPYDKGLRVVKVCRRSMFADDRDRIKGISSLDPLHDLIVSYNVKTVVIDNLPEPVKVRNLREIESIEVYGCEYLRGGRGVVNWDSSKGIVTVNRTEICDSTHDLVITPGMFQLPRRSEEIEEYFIPQMCNLAKVLEEDAETGSKEFWYRKLGVDHYRHALNYALLGSQRIGIYVPKEVQKRVSDAWDVEEKGSTSWMGV